MERALLPDLWALCAEYNGPFACPHSNVPVSREVDAMFNRPEWTNVRLHHPETLRDVTHVQWLVERFEFPHKEVQLAFVEACSCSHLPVAQWLAERFQLGTDDVLMALRESAFKGQAEAFRDSACHGYTAVARWYQARLSDHDVRAELQRACKRGLVGTAQFIADERQLTDDVARRWLVLECAAEGGHTAMLRWIKAWFSPTPREAQDAVWTACQHGKLQAAQWLAAAGPPLSSSEESGLNRALTWAANDGNVRVLEWIFNYYGLTIEHAQKAKVMRTACRNDQREAVEWLVKRFDDQLDERDMFLPKYDQVRWERDERGEMEFFIEQRNQLA